MQETQKDTHRNIQNDLQTNNDIQRQITIILPSRNISGNPDILPHAESGAVSRN